MRSLAVTAHDEPLKEESFVCQLQALGGTVNPFYYCHLCALDLPPVGQVCGVHTAKLEAQRIQMAGPVKQLVSGRAVVGPKYLRTWPLPFLLWVCTPWFRAKNRIWKTRMDLDPDL